MFKPVSIRRSLITNLVLLIVLLSGSLMIAVHMTARDSVAALSDSLIRATFDKVDLRLGQFFQPLEAILRIQSNWLAQHDADLADTARLNDMMLPVLSNVSQASSINISDPTGRSYMLLRNEAGWHNRTTDPEQWQNRTYWKHWSNEGNLIKDEWVELDYDATERPWFNGAVALHDQQTDAAAPPATYWTEPYTFYTTQEPGLTCSLYTETKSGQPLVVAIDVLLSDLSDYTQSLRISDNGMVFIMTEEGRVLGLPSTERFHNRSERENCLLKPINELQIPAVDSALSKWATEEDQTQAVPIFSFVSDMDLWWAGVKPYHLGDGRTLYIGVLVPASDLFKPTRQQVITLAVVTSVVLILSLAATLWLARRYSAPLDQLSKQSDNLRKLHLTTPAKIESGILEVQRLADSQERMRAALDAFARYVPMDVVHQLLDEGVEARVGGEERELTILFTDIVGFTGITESLTADDMAAHLSDYFQQIIEVIRRHGGTVDKFVGDAIVAFWGAPHPMEAHASKAVTATLACMRRLNTLNEIWTKDSKPPLHTRFGLASGPVAVGNFGAPARLSYTAIGDSVNLASRLEELNRYYGSQCLATTSVKAASPEDIIWRHIDRVIVRGRTQPTDIYELVGRADDLDSKALQQIEQYEAALQVYQSGDFHTALMQAKTLAADDPSDNVIQQFIARCQHQIDDPPPGKWDGITRMQIK